MSIFQKLEAIQKELNAPKNQYNSFGKYHYRSCEDILGAVKPLLNGCALIVTDEIQMIGDRFYVVATAKLTDGKETVEAKGYAREELQKKGMDASQLTGATSSYARKYALNGLFAIDDAKDADATNDHGKRATQQNQQQNQQPTQQRSVVMDAAVLETAIEVIYGTETESDLRYVFGKSWRQTTCPAQRAELKKAYDAQLKKLTGE